jgi:hypothetical protein
MGTDVGAGVRVDPKDVEELCLYRSALQISSSGPTVYYIKQIEPLQLHVLASLGGFYIVVTMIISLVFRPWSPPSAMRGCFGARFAVEQKSLRGLRGAGPEEKGS